MLRSRIFTGIVLVVILSAGCKKNSQYLVCDMLKEGMITDNTGEVKSVITLFITRLPGKTHTQINLELLASYIGQCNISAEVLCFNCIYTYPGQSEIRLSFTSEGSTVEKTLDISNSPDDSNMKMLSMHD